MESPRTRTQAGAGEDTLLFDVAANAQVVRYPVTLSADPLNHEVASRTRALSVSAVAS